MTQVETDNGTKEEWTVAKPRKKRHKSKRKHKSKKKRRHSSNNNNSESNAVESNNDPMEIDQPPIVNNNEITEEPQISTRTSITGKRKENPSYNNNGTTDEPQPKRVKRQTSKNSFTVESTTTNDNQSNTLIPKRTNKKPKSDNKRKRNSDPNHKKKPMALYKVITNMIKQLILHDQHSIFYERVTDDIAPNYTSIIKYPMCFLQMREKLSKRLYKTLEAAQMDFKLIFTNAMEYNPPDTIYYDEAKRVMEEAKKLALRYKEKLDPSEIGDSDPLFTDDKAVPIAIDPDEIKRQEEEKQRKEREAAAKQERQERQQRAQEKQKSSTPQTPRRNRTSSNRKRKRDTLTSQNSTPKSAPSLLSEAVPVQLLDTAISVPGNYYFLEITRYIL